MRIGIPEILLLILLAVILLGARRIPELGAALGKALREFRKAEKDEDKEILPHKKDGKNDNATHDKK